jgi:5-methylcytosine-specific restriction endonuclease McrA
VRWNHSSVGYALIGNTHAANSFGIGSEESQCVDCHSVHGANAITIGQTTIAKKDPGVSGGTTVENENTFCNNCHSLKHTATTSYNTTSHVQKAAGASYGNVPPATYSGRVAWADSTDCSSCHYIGDGTDRNYTTPVKNFPHITQDATNPTTNGVWQFLDTDYQSTNVAYTDPDSSLSNFDNICMRCHTSNNSYSPTVSTLGAVGYTF